MWPISTALAAALSSRSRQPLWRADVTLDGDPVPGAAGLRVDANSGGTLTVSTGDPRRSVSLTLVDDSGDLVPAGASDALAPYGNEISLYASLNLGGAVEWIPVGVFGIQSAVSAWAGGAVTVAVTGRDRSQRVAQDLLTDYLSIAAGTGIGAAIHTLIDDALPASQQFSFAALSTVIAAQTYQPGDDRWAQATALAQDAGCLLYFDPAGVCTLIPVPDASTAPVAWQFAPGETSVAVSAQNSLDRTEAANVIIVTAQGTGVDVPLISIARDTNPNSPTYVNGKFGAAVKSLSTSTLTTQADVDTYAAAQLRLYAGVTQQAQLTALPLWHLDAWDVIQADVSKVALSGRYVIDQLSIPIGPGTMSITTRGVVVNA